MLTCKSLSASRAARLQPVYQRDWYCQYDKRFITKKMFVSWFTVTASFQYMHIEWNKHVPAGDCVSLKDTRFVQCGWCLLVYQPALLLRSVVNVEPYADARRERLSTCVCRVPWANPGYWRKALVWTISRSSGVLLMKHMGTVLCSSWQWKVPEADLVHTHDCTSGEYGLVDVCCRVCSTPLGWQYLDASVPVRRYSACFWYEICRIDINLYELMCGISQRLCA